MLIRQSAVFACLAVLRLAVCLPAPALAADGAGEIPILPPVTVVGTLDNPATGRSVMDRKMIEKLPAGNGSINELLRLFPDVQVGEETRASKRAGEILPPAISIAGGKTFDNTFEIDGLGNSNFLDPAADNPFDLNSVPAQAQTLFPEADLIDRITLYDSNIPARYSGFTGGVIDLETRDPRPDFGGSLFYRTTRDDWTSFHLAAGEEAPEFAKNHAGISLDLPLSSHLGVLASYQQLLSRLPQRHLGDAETEERRLENYFAKAVLEHPESRAEISFLATPYRSENFLPDIRNSSFRLRGGGYKAQAGLDRFLPAGTLRLLGGYGWSSNRRQAPQELRQMGDHRQPRLGAADRFGRQL